MEENKIAEAIKKQQTLDSVRSALRSNQSQEVNPVEAQQGVQTPFQKQKPQVEEEIKSVNKAGQNIFDESDPNYQKIQKEVSKLQEEFTKFQQVNQPKQKQKQTKEQKIEDEKKKMQEEIQRLQNLNKQLSEKNRRLKLELQVLKEIQPKKKKLITTQPQQAAPSMNKTQENQLIERLKYQLKSAEQELQRLNAEQNYQKTGPTQAKGLCSCTQQKTFQLNQLEQRYQKLEELAQEYKQKFETINVKYGLAQQALQDEQDKNYKFQEDLRRVDHFKSEINYLQERVNELEQEKRKLLANLRELSNKPFFQSKTEKGPSKEQIEEFENDITELKKRNKELNERYLDKENEIIPLREKNRMLQETLTNERGQFKILQIQFEEKQKMLNNHEEQMKLFTSIQEEDFDYFKQALGMLKLRQEPKWANVDFLTKTLNSDDIPQLKREIERLKLEKLTIATELDKIQTLLSIKNDMEKETKEVYEREIDSLKIQVKAANNRAEEMARLADFRANRVIQLEKNMRLNIYDESMKIVASKDQLQYSDLMIADFEDAPLTEIGITENVLDLYFADAEFYEQSLSIAVNEKLGKIATFVTIDFYNHETQSTPIIEGFRPNFNTLITFKFQVDDFFIKYMEKETIRIELHLCRGKEHLTFGIAQIQLEQLLIRSSPLAEQSLKVPVIEGLATIVSNQDNESSLGLIKYKIRMRKPISEALRLYREKKDIIEQAGLQVLETFQKLPKPDLPKRVLMITIYRAVKLMSKNENNLAPFIYFQFYTFDETISKTAAGKDAIFDENFSFDVTIDIAFQKYLETQQLEFIVFDDNAPQEEKRLSDFIGTAKLKLINLLQDKNIDGYIDLISSNGIHVGQLQIRIGWSDSVQDEKGYGTPLTRVWEKELYQKIGQILTQKNLNLNSAFNIFDQDGDGAINAQEFRNTLLITLRINISEQDIQLLLNAATLVNGCMTKAEFNRKFEGILDKEEQLSQQDMKQKVKQLGPKFTEQAQKESLKFIFNRIKSALKGDVTKLWQVFEQFDKNFTYQVTPENFRYIIKILQIQLTEPEMNQLMFIYDPNLQGHFNYVEFLKNLQESLQNNEEVQMMKKIGKALSQHNISLLEAFKTFDKNGNGKISKEEFFQTFQKLNLGIPTQQIQSLWNVVERDQDDCINYQLFCENFSPHIEAQVPPKAVSQNKPEDVRQKLSRLVKENNIDLRDYFNFFDNNKDGKISKDEFRQALEKLELKLTFYDITALINAGDKDKNGIIDYQEFCQFVAPKNEDTLKKLSEIIKKEKLDIEDAFLQLDQNQDGYISRQEFKDFFTQKNINLYPNEIEELINKMASKNNRVSYKDFLQSLKEAEAIPKQPTLIEKIEKPQAEPQRDVIEIIAQVIKEDKLSIKKVFDSFDSDKSGEISEEELKKMLGNMNLKLTQNEIKNVIQKVNKSKTGFITYGEFISVFAQYGVAPDPKDLNSEFFKSEQDTFRSQASARSKSKKEPVDIQLQEALQKISNKIKTQKLKVHELFSLHDSDADGKLTIAQFKTCIEGILAGLTQPQFGALVKHVDQNLDGSISIKEFEDLLQECLPQEASVILQKKQKNPADIAAHINNYLIRNNFDLIKIFNKFDQSSNSYLSKLELGKGLDSIGATVTPREFDNIWQEMTSGDKVSYAQFDQFIQKYQKLQSEENSRQKAQQANESLKSTINSNRSTDSRKK